MKPIYLRLWTILCVCGVFVVNQAEAGEIRAFADEMTVKQEPVVQVKAGEVFQICLPSDAETGYIWIPEVPEGIIYQTHDYDAFSASGAVEVLSFIAGKTGVYELTLRKNSVFVTDVVKTTVTYTVMVGS